MSNQCSGSSLSAAVQGRVAAGRRRSFHQLAPAAVLGAERVDHVRGQAEARGAGRPGSAPEIRHAAGGRVAGRVCGVPEVGRAARRRSGSPAAGLEERDRAACSSRGS